MIKRGSKQYRHIIGAAEADIKEKALENPNDMNTYGVNVNLDTGDYTLEPIKNSQQFIKSLNSPKTHFDYDFVAENIQLAVNNNNVKEVKGILHLVNCSLFANESKVNEAFTAINRVNFSDYNKSFSLVFKELLRLNIWGLISEGKGALHHKYSYNDYLEGIYLNSSSTFTHSGSYLPRDLRLEVKAALDNQYSPELATKDVVEFISNHHFLIAHRTLLMICLERLNHKLMPLSKQISSSIKINDFLTIRADLDNAESYLIKITNNSSTKLNKSFPSFAHKLLIDIPARNISDVTNDGVLVALGKFDLFLMKLEPSVLEQRHDVDLMRVWLSNLVAKDKYFRSMGIQPIFKKPIKYMTNIQVINALQIFIDWLDRPDSQKYILNEIIKNRVL